MVLCFSLSFVTCATGRGHPWAGDRCGWTARHAQWCWTGSQGQGRTHVLTCFRAWKTAANSSYFILFFPVLQDLLVDCFKPTEVKHSSAHKLPLPLQVNISDVHICHSESPHVFLSSPSPRRTSSQSCSTRSEGCRSSPRLRRNDGILPPSILHIPLHLSPHLSSSYHSSRYFFKIFFVCFLPLKFMKCCNLFLLLVRPSLAVAWIQPHMSLFSFVVMLLDFLHKNHQPRRGEKDKLKSELIQKRLIGLNPGILLPPLFLLLPLSPPFFFLFWLCYPFPSSSTSSPPTPTPSSICLRRKRRRVP